MKRLRLLALVTCLAATAAPGDPAPSSSYVASVVVDLDRQLNRAIVAHDVALAGSLYDDDFLLTVSGGGYKRKADMLADIRNVGVVLTACETTDVVVRVRGETAVLTGLLHQAGTVNGREIDAWLRVTDTWVAVDGRWRLLAGHASPAKPPTPAGA
ncbi:MAG: nuclear transport factor 2 family protein [Steroidobacteraceae bacterium]